MQIVAGIVLSWVHNPSKAGNELFHRAASALDRTPKLQPCPLHRNACLQAPAPYAIALGDCREIGGVRPKGVFSGRFSRRGRGNVAWIVKLVSIGAEGEEHSTDVMRIAKPDTLADLGTLGLSLVESKQLLAGIRGEIAAAQARVHAVHRPECPVTSQSNR